VFTQHLSGDPGQNQSLWQRSPHNPLIPARAQDWCKDFLANSMILEIDGSLIMYVEGSSDSTEQIGAFTCPIAEIEKGEWTAHRSNPILRVSEGSFDSGSVFDPSVVRFGDEYRMYYSATKGDPHDQAKLLSDGVHDVLPTSSNEETIGAAIAEDPFRFTKLGHEAVMEGRCPHVVQHEGTLYMFFVKVVDGGYRIYLAISEDGVDFHEVNDGAILTVGAPGEWDSQTVTTPQVIKDDGYFCMLYAGDDRSVDDPSGIGLAVSEDLVHWNKIDGNPIFVTGPPGQFDSATIACPILREFNGKYYLWYAGSDRSIRDGLHSQVGMAILEPSKG
jgi:predicted GH43/DUF377 family glycosyl hydrolase